MVIGFTGTRRGMTPKQRRRITALVIKYMPNKVRHGVCTGSDEDFHGIVRDISKAIWIEGHPSNLPKYTAQVACDFMHPPKEPKERDKDIVAGVDLMFATPGENYERGRGSGTWFTIRESRRQGVKVIVVYP